jgi:hypothetical protein
LKIKKAGLISMLFILMKPPAKPAVFLSNIHRVMAGFMANRTGNLEQASLRVF